MARVSKQDNSRLQGCAHQRQVGGPSLGELSWAFEQRNIELVNAATDIMRMLSELGESDAEYVVAADSFTIKIERPI